MAKVVAEYELKVKKALKDLDKLQKEVKELDGGLKKTGKDGSKALDDVGEKAGGLGSTFKKLGGLIAAAFTVDAIVNFGKEAVRLAAQAEGIETAFRKLNNPNLLNDLRKATRGTVTDLKLMQSAVRANNFQIPLEKLATFFEFATKRSIETGESVDYLVNSIVDGIGRKSTLVLDNLGISASQLQAEIKKTGDFGVAAANIIEESLEQTGDVADTTQIRMAKLSTATENLQKAIGVILAEQSTPFVKFLTNVATALEKDITEIERLRQELEGDSGLTLLSRQTEELAKLKDLEREATEAAGKVSDAEFLKLNEKVKTQREIVEAIEDELDARADYNMNTEITIDLINKEIAAHKERQEETVTYVRSLNQLNSELKLMDKEFKNLEIGSDAWNKKIIEISQKTSELEAATRKAQARLVMFQQAARGFDPFKTDEEDGSEFLEGLEDDLKDIEKLTDEYMIDSEKLIFGEEGSEAIQAKLDAQLKAALDKWRKFNDDRQEDTELTDQEIGQIIAQTFQAIAQLSDTISQIVQNNYQSEIDSLQRRFDEEKITREQFEEEKKELQRDAAASEKSARLFSAILNTAASITAALTIPPPAGPILAGINAALGAAQIGAIASQPLPQFAEGVIDLKGEGTETSDSIHAKLSRGESVMTAKETRKYRDELQAIRDGRFENLILTKYVTPMIDESMFNGFKDIGKSAKLNGLKAELKDHNIIHSQDRMRQEFKHGFMYLAKELKVKNQKRGGYRA